jgi:6-pyruvoyltetrahydropterin/6-carboxytetrahydropterin synthase
VIVIGKVFDFAAAHQLGLADLSTEENEERFGKCASLHGHNYRLTVEVTGNLNEDEMVLNYYKLADIVQPLIDKWDHQFLNEHFECLTTAEQIALWAAGEIRSTLPNGVILHRVRLQESEKTFADVY